MSRARADYSLTRRSLGRVLSAAAGIVLLGFAAYIARAQSIPELGVYDGWWMLLWSTVAVLAAVPWLWHWPRERSLLALALVSVAGCWGPLVVSAARHGMPLMARLKGAWMLSGAGLVGVAAPLGFVCLWLAVREHTTMREGRS